MQASSRLSDVRRVAQLADRGAVLASSRPSDVIVRGVKASSRRGSVAVGPKASSTLPLAAQCSAVRRPARAADSDDVPPVGLRHVHGFLAVEHRQVQRLAGLARKPVERRPGGDQVAAREREQAEPAQLGAEPEGFAPARALEKTPRGQRGRQTRRRALVDAERTGERRSTRAACSGLSKA